MQNVTQKIILEQNIEGRTWELAKHKKSLIDCSGRRWWFIVLQGY